MLAFLYLGSVDAKAFRAFGRASELSEDGGNTLPHDSVYRLSAKDIDGQTVKLSKYSGGPAIIVNVASK